MEIRNLAREHEYIWAAKPKTKWSKDVEQHAIYEKEQKQWERLLKSQMLWEMGERVRNVLARQGIRTDYDLLRHTQDQLLGFTNFGHGSLHEVIRVLDLHGYVMPLGEENGN